MALLLPEVPAAGTTIGSELALLDIQTEHSEQLHDIGVYSIAASRLIDAGSWPTDALVRPAIYEHRTPTLPHLTAGGVALLANDGTSLTARPLGRVYVYNRVNECVMAQDGFTPNQARAVSSMANDLRAQARHIGLVLCPSLVELFRTPLPGQERRHGPVFPLR